MILTTVLGFDVGTKKTGIALGNLVTVGARPLTIVFGDKKQQLLKIEAILKEWNPGHLIVGLPVHLDGQEHQMTKKSLSFGNEIKRRFFIPVSFIDERLSTDAAKQHCPKQLTDAVSATIILQDWLDSQNSLY